MDAKTYDLLLFVTLFLGIWEGVLPMILAATTGDFWGLAFPVLLPSPWVWVVSGAVIVVAFALLVILDTAKKRWTAGDSR